MTRIGNVYGEAMYSLAREESAAAAVLEWAEATAKKQSQ